MPARRRSSGRYEYDLLGVSPNASDEEIAKAYRRKKAQLHPDKVNGKRRRQGLPPDPEADRRFRELGLAFAAVMDERYPTVTAASAKYAEASEPTWADPIIGRWDSLSAAIADGRLQDILDGAGSLFDELSSAQDRALETIDEYRALYDRGASAVEKARRGFEALSSRLFGRR